MISSPSQLKSSRVIKEADTTPNMGWKPQIELTGAVEHHAGEEGNRGNANLIVNGADGVKFYTLTTDYDYSKTQMSHAAGSPVYVSYITANKLGYVRVIVTSQSGRKRVFYARTNNSQGFCGVSATENASTRHLYLKSPPGSRWLGAQELRHIIQTQAQPADMALNPEIDPQLLFGHPSAYKVTQEDKKQWLAAATALMDDAQNLKNTAKSGAASKGFTAHNNGWWNALDKLYGGASRNNGENIHDGQLIAYEMTGPTSYLTQQHEVIKDKRDINSKTIPGYEGDAKTTYYALSQDWNTMRTDIDSLARGNMQTAQQYALAELLLNGSGVRLGAYYDSNSQPRLGFKIFTPANPKDAHNVGGLKLIKSLQRYVDKMAEAEARATVGKDYQERAQQIASNTISRLTKLYANSDNQSDNGVISAKEMVSETVGMKNLRERVVVSPLLFNISRYSLARKLSITSIQPPSEEASINQQLDELRQQTNSVNTSIKLLLQNHADEAINVQSGRTKKMQHIMQQWIPVMQAYDHENVDVSEDDLINLKMANWVIRYQTVNEKRKRDPDTGDSHIEHETRYALIPPTVPREKRQAIIDKLTAEGYVDQWDGNSTSVAQFIRQAYIDNENGGNRIMITDGKIQHPITDISRHAATYVSSATTDAQALQLMRDYGFDSNRPHRTATPLLRAEENLIQYLNSVKSEHLGYKNATDRLTAIYKEVFRRNTQGTVGEVLFRLGEIRLKDRHMTVRFGPSGALYVVRGRSKEGKKMLEELPVRPFAEDSIYIDTLKRLADIASGRRERKDTRIDSQLFMVDVKGKEGASAVDAATYNSWYTNLRRQIESVQQEDWAIKLHGLGMYSKYADLALVGQFRNTEIPNAGYGRDIKNVDLGRFAGKWVEQIHDEDIKLALTQNSYAAVKTYLESCFGQDAARTAAFTHDYNVNSEVEQQLNAKLAEQINTTAAVLQGSVEDWRKMEELADTAIADSPDAERFVKSMYDLEENQAPSAVSRAIAAVTAVINHVYDRFIKSFQTVFDLLNPAKIMTNLGMAFVDTIKDAAQHFFQLLFTNFIDKHFAAAPNAQRFITGWMGDSGVKIYRQHDIKFLKNMLGSNALTMETDAHKWKYNKLGGRIEIVPNWSNLEVDKDVAYRTFGHPFLIATNPKADDPKIELVYHVDSEDEFHKLTNTYLHQLQKGGSEVDSWWNKHGVRLLQPAAMNDNEHGANNLVWDFFKRLGGRDPSSFIRFNGSDVHIKLNLEDANIDPRQLYGTQQGMKISMKHYKEEMSQRDRDARRQEREEQTPRGKWNGLRDASEAVNRMNAKNEAAEREEE